MYIDVHAHYDDERFDEDRDLLISGFKEKDIGLIINCGATYETSLLSLKLAEKYDFIYACCGIHPNDADTYLEVLPKIEEFLKNEKCVGIGETGLDYHYENSDRDNQKVSFRAHMDLSLKYNLPVVIHSRDATQDSLDIISDYKSKGVMGMFHCFSGGPDVAKTVLDAGYYISLGGTVTFKNSKKAVETVKYTPLDRLLTETDCPYLSPEPRRGKRNDSGNIPFVVKKIAEIKGVSEDKVTEAVLNNAKNLFRKII